VKESDLHAEGNVVKAGRRISVAEMRVSSSNGELIAIGTGTYIPLDGVPIGVNT
jgi:acyl-coenzyme A thioesterase PaaI-like protein